MAHTDLPTHEKITGNGGGTGDNAGRGGLHGND